MTNGQCIPVLPWVILLEQRPSAAAVAGNEVDDDSAGKDEDRVFGGGDVDAKPLAGGLFCRRGHGLLAPFEDVIVIVKVPLRTKVVGAGNVDEKVAAIAGQRLLRNFGDDLAPLADCVFGTTREHGLGDVGQLLLLHVREGWLVEDGYA